MLDRTIAPETRPFGFRKLPAETVEILPNGITFHRYSGGDQPVCNLLVSFSGGVQETPTEYEAQMAMSMLQEGTAKYSGADIAEILDFNGARFIRSTSAHRSGVNITMLNSGADEVLTLLADMLTAPSFPADAVEAAKNVATSQLQINSSKVSFLADKECARMIWGDSHPTSKVATEEEIRAISRNTLSAWYSRMASGRTCHVFLSGLLDDRLVDKVRDFLLSLNLAGEGVESLIIPMSPAAAGVNFVEKEGARQNAVAAAIPAIPRSHPDYIPLRLAIVALGGYFGSRLMANIREEKGYTYGISSYLAGSLEGSFTGIAAQCDMTYTEPVITEIRNELRDLVLNPPSGEELRRLKLFCSTSLIETLDSPISIMGYYATSLFAGIPDGYFEAQQRAIEALTPDTIAEMAEKYLRPDDLRIAVAGTRI